MFPKRRTYNPSPSSSSSVVSGSVSGGGGAIGKHNRITVVLGDGSSGLTVNLGTFIQPADVPNEAVANIMLQITGIRTDYTNGFAGRFLSKWKKSAAGVWTKIGADVNEIENGAGGATTVVIADDGAHGLQVTVTTVAENHFIFASGTVDLVTK